MSRFIGAVRRAKGEERGAYAILFAILVVALFIMTAVVIDLSAARAYVRDNRTRADSATLAAIALLPEDPEGACAAAWDYLLANTDELRDLTPTSPCESGVDELLSDNVPCNSFGDAVEYQALGEAPFDITFTYPIPDGHPLLQGRSSPNDGDDPCERFAVTIRLNHGTLFGGIIGASELSAPASTVGRGFTFGQPTEAVALLLLDPTGCDALTTGSDNVKVHVLGNGESPGRISIDSDGTRNGNAIPGCDNDNSYTIDTNNTADVDKIKAFPAEIGGKPGRIRLFAMEVGQIGCVDGVINHACDPDDVDEDRIVPEPNRPRGRTTREPWDWEYNCKTGYPNFHVIVDIRDCEDVTGDTNGNGIPDSAFIDELRNGIGNAGNPDALTYERFTTSTLIPLPPGDDRCTQGSSDPPLTVPAVNGALAPINWWVDCSTFTVRNSTTFLGGNVVFDGDVNVAGQGSLSINGLSSPNPNLSVPCLTVVCISDSSQDASFVFIRGNNSVFQKGAQASVALNNTFVYIANGRVDMGAGDGEVTWIAPLEGPFEDLALWSERSALNVIGGQANLGVDGVFFVPEANPFRFAGQGCENQQKAQFVSYRMTVDGNGCLNMKPDPDRIVLTPAQDFFLIR